MADNTFCSLNRTYSSSSRTTLPSELLSHWLYVGLLLFSHSVVSNSLWPRGQQHARLPCPSPTPEFTQTYVHWVGDAIQPSHPLLFPSPPALNLSQHQSFPRSQFFASGGQSIRVSASVSVLPMNIQDWFPLGWTGWIASWSKRTSRVFSNTSVESINSLALSFDWSKSHIHTWLLEKP